MLSPFSDILLEDALLQLSHQSLALPPAGERPQGGAQVGGYSLVEGVDGEDLGQGVEQALVFVGRLLVQGSLPGVYFLELVAEEFQLELQAVVGHRGGELEGILALPELVEGSLSPLDVLQQEEDDGAAEAYHASPLSEGVHRTVLLLPCLFRLGVHPLLHGFPQLGRVEEPSQGGEFACALHHALHGGRELVVGHLVEAARFQFPGILVIDGDVLVLAFGQSGEEHAPRHAVLHAVRPEALVHCASCAQNGPVVRHVRHPALGVVAVVVLSPFAVVETESVDVVLARPRPGAVGLAQRVQFLSEGEEVLPLAPLESLQERGAGDGDGHVEDVAGGSVGHLVVLSSLAQEGAVLVLLLPLPLVLGGHRSLPHLDDVCHGGLAAGLVAHDDAHPVQAVHLAVDVPHAHVGGIRHRQGHESGEDGHLHLVGLALEGVAQADGEPGQPFEEFLVVGAVGQLFGLFGLFLGVSFFQEGVHHHLQVVGHLALSAGLARRLAELVDLLLGQSAVGDGLEDLLILELADVAHPRGKLEEDGVPLPFLRHSPIEAEPLLGYLAEGDALVGASLLHLFPTLAPLGCVGGPLLALARLDVVLDGEVGVEEAAVEVEEILEADEVAEPCQVLAGRVGREVRLLGKPRLVLLDAPEVGAALAHHPQPLPRGRDVRCQDAQFVRSGGKPFPRLPHRFLALHLVEVYHVEAAGFRLRIEPPSAGEVGLPGDAGKGLLERLALVVCLCQGDAVQEGYEPRVADGLVEGIARTQRAACPHAAENVEPNHRVSPVFQRTAPFPPVPRPSPPARRSDGRRCPARTRCRSCGCVPGRTCR